MKKRKLVLALMLSLMLLVTMIPSLSFADETGSAARTVASGNCGATGHESEVTWSFDETSGTLTISGSGAMADYDSNGKRDWNQYAANITNVVVEEGVTYVGARTFQGLACTAVSLPASLDALSDMAFGSMQKLESITLADGNKNYTVQDNVLFTKDMTTLIKYPAKKSDTAYKIPDGVKTIGKHAFSHTGEGGLTDISLPDSLESIGSYAFQGNAGGSDFTIPDSVTELGEGAFSSNTAIKSITIGAGLKEIINSCFTTSSLETVNFVEGTQLQTIGGYAFDNCPKLANINLPSTVQEIGQMAFRNCSSLSTIQFGRELKTIGQQAFYGCTSLQKVELEGAIESIAKNAFVNCPIVTLSISADADLTIQNDSFYYSQILSSMKAVSVGSKKGTVTLEGSLLSRRDTSTLKLFGNIKFASSSGLMYLAGSVENSNWHTLDMTEVTGIEFTSGTDSTDHDRVWALGGNPSYRNKGIIYLSKSDVKDEMVQKNFHGRRPVIYAVTNDGIFADNAKFEAATLATPERAGYIFDGWYTSADFAENTKLESNSIPEDVQNTTYLTYYAKWIAKEKPELSYQDAECEKHVNDKAFTNPLTKKPEDVVVSYSSDNEDVAKVNAKTGEVTIVGAGEATITATAEESSQYAGASASYHLTVTDHKYNDNEWKSDKDGHWQECMICNHETEVNSHDFQWVVDKEATTTEKGSKHEECKVCGFAKDAVEIPVIENGTTGGDQNNGNAGGTTADKADSANAANGAKTGDSMPIGMLAVLMIAAAAGIAVCGRKLYKSR